MNSANFYETPLIRHCDSKLRVEVGVQINIDRSAISSEGAFDKFFNSVLNAKIFNNYKVSQAFKVIP